MTKYAATRRAYNETHQAEICANKATYYQSNKIRIDARKQTPKYKATQKARSSKHYAANKTEIRIRLSELRLVNTYGITVEDYNRMSENQNHKCAICRKPEHSRKLAVDHCHASGKVRALLCGPCNKLLGVYEKNKDAFAAYLREYGR